jgi:hypothetical protein
VADKDEFSAWGFDPEGEGQKAMTHWGHLIFGAPGERLKGLGMRYTPAYKMIDQWHGNLMYPNRQDYTEVRKLVRSWQREQGEAPFLGGEMPKNYNYYKVFEAMRDGNLDEITDAVVQYKKWAQTEGLKSEDARLRLRSSLSSRQPVNLAEGRKAVFFKSLPEDKRITAESEDKRYNTILNRITKQPGIPAKPARPAQPAKPSQGGNWYAAH